jgi:hypothetical protein
MTLRPLTSNTAQEIAAAVPGILRDRADHDDPRDWANIDSYRRFVAMLRSGVAWVVNDTTVAAQVIGPDADIWSYVIAEAFDTASQDYDLPRGHIHHTALDVYAFDLDCTCGGACTLPAE